LALAIKKRPRSVWFFGACLWGEHLIGVASDLNYFSKVKLGPIGSGAGKFGKKSQRH
jgi:hypothetical protein